MEIVNIIAEVGITLIFIVLLAYVITYVGENL